MNPAELGARLDRRFQVLAGGRRGKVERHQTLRAVIDWSYDLLTVEEKRLLARTTVFSGGWTLGAAEAVCAQEPIDVADVFGLTERLVARSLVIAEDLGFQTRYRLLETIRQYGEERLVEHGETADLRRRHADYYLGLTDDLVARIAGPEQVAVGRLFAAERDNLLAGLGSSIDDGDTASAFRWFEAWPMFGYQLGYVVPFPFEALLAMPGAADDPRYALALGLAAVSAATAGDRERAERRLDETIAAQQRLGSQPRVEVAIVATRGALLFADGDFLGAAEPMERAAAIHRTLGDLASTAYDLAGAAVMYASGGDAKRAMALAEEGLAMARQLGTPSVIGMNLNALASAIAEQEPRRAQALLRESIDARRQCAAWLREHQRAVPGDARVGPRARLGTRTRDRRTRSSTASLGRRPPTARWCHEHRGSRDCRASPGLGSRHPGLRPAHRARRRR
jgi:hypothetical protein